MVNTRKRKRQQPKGLEPAQPVQQEERINVLDDGDGDANASNHGNEKNVSNVNDSNRC